MTFARKSTSKKICKKSKNISAGRADMAKAAIIGPGSFGTALAQAISHNVSNVYLFGRNEGIVKSINERHINRKYYPLTKLSPNIAALNLSTDCDVLETTDLVIFSVPSGVTREVAKFLRACCKGNLIVSSANAHGDTNSPRPQMSRRSCEE